MKRLILAALALCFAAGAHAQTISPALGIPANLATFPAYANEASIRAAASAANSAGGGVVQIPVGTIAITSALPMYANVFYKGVGAAWDMNAGTTAGGTIINCAGGNFNGFEYNPTDAANNAVSPLLSEIHGGGVFGVAIKNCAYGVKIGAKFKGGINALQMDNVLAVGNSQWGIWIENAHNAQIGSLQAFNNAVGQVAFGASGTTYWNYGNDTIVSIIAEAANSATLTSVRGVSFFGRGNSALNDVQVGHVTSIGTSGNYSFSPTITPASANLGVSDLTKFALGTLVYVTSGASGFTTGLTYVVSAVSAASGAGTIQLSTQMGGSAVVASAGAPAMNTNGGAALEAGGWDTGSYISALNLAWVDTEAAPDFYGQTLSTSQVSFGLISVFANASNIMLRGLDGTSQLNYFSAPTRYDADTATVRNTGAEPSAYVNQPPSGFFTAGTVTASAPVVNLTQTWNNAGVAFTGLQFNVTDTASTGSSKLLDLKIAGSSKFAVFKDGGFSAASGSTSTAGNLIVTSLYDRGYAASTPTAGQTVIIADTADRAVINPAGTLATLTVRLPTCSAAYDGKLASFASSQAITALTVTATAGSIVAAGSSLAAGVGEQFICLSSGTTWYRTY